MKWPFVTRKRLEGAVAQHDRDRAEMELAYGTLFHAWRALLEKKIEEWKGEDWRRIAAGLEETGAPHFLSTRLAALNR